MWFGISVKVQFGYAMNYVTWKILQVMWSFDVLGETWLKCVSSLITYMIVRQPIG